MEKHYTCRVKANGCVGSFYSSSSSFSLPNLLSSVPDILLLLLSAVLCVLPQFAAAGAAVGVRLHEELHLHYRETLRPLQPEVGDPGSFQRGQYGTLSAVCSRLCLFTSLLLVSPAFSLWICSVHEGWKIPGFLGILGKIWHTFQGKTPAGCWDFYGVWLCVHILKKFVCTETKM